VGKQRRVSAYNGGKKEQQISKCADQAGLPSKEEGDGGGNANPLKILVWSGSTVSAYLGVSGRKFLHSTESGRI